MATQVQFRRGTTSQNNAFTGAAAEFTVDTDVWTIRIHDGTTQGGHIVPTLTGTQTLTNKTIGSNSVWNGSAVGLGYGGTGASLSAVAGAVVYSTGSAMALSLAGTSGQVLTSGGTSGPTWVNASSLSTGTATTATRAANIDGGSAGYLVYQQDTNTTGFIAPGSDGYVLRSTGASTAPTWVTPNFTLGTTAVALGTSETNFTGINTFYITGTTDASSTTTGVLRVAGGASIQKKLYVGSDLTVSGNLTVNGTTTNINTTNLVVEDKNIVIADVASPTDTTADGGGITLKGATDKTFNWVDATDSWTSSEHMDIASGKSFKIATTPVLTATTVLNDSSQTSIGIGGYATTISIGASTGATTINHELDVTGNLVVTGDAQIKGGDLTTDQTTFNLLNTTTTTLNVGGAATTTNIGSTSSGTTNIGYDARVKHDLTVDGDVQIKGGDLTTNQTTFNLLNATATTVNIGGEATTVNIGASTGTLTVKNAATVFDSTSNIKLPVGTIAQRPGTPSAGMVRYNSEISSFEGYASGAWSSLGGVKSVDGLTYILAETSAGASNDELEFYTATDASNTAKRGGWNKTRLQVNTPILVSSDANLTDFPNAKIVSSNGNTGDSHGYNAGLVGEGVASGSDDTIWGVGVYGVGASNGSTKSAGVIGDGHVSNTGDTGSAVGVRGYSTDTHAGGLNVGLYGLASGSSVGNYALWMEGGNVHAGAAQSWELYDNSSSSLSFGSTGKSDILKLVTTDSAEGVTMSGTLGVTGAVTLSSSASVGGTLSVTGNQTNTGDLAVNGGDITTTSTTATVFNTGATTLNIGGAATTMNIGASSTGAAVNVGKDLYVAGNLYVTGTQSTGSIATVSGADSVIYVSAGATGNTKEIGLIGEYKPSSTTLYTGLLKDHTDGIWKFFSNPTNPPTAGTTQSFTGATYDAVKMGALTATTGSFSSTLDATGNFNVNTNKFSVVASSGNTTVAGTLGVTGATTLAGLSATTGSFSSTLSVTGHVTLEGVTSTGATGTGALVFGTSPSLTTPTLGVATATSINKMAITAPATGSTLAVADGKTFTVSNSITLAGTDSTTITLPSTTGTVALNDQVHYIGTTSVAINRTSANLALTGISSVTFPGSTSGTIQLLAAATAGTGTVITMPATTGTVVTTGDTGTVTNTMLAGSIANAKLANSTISGVSLGSNLNALTIGTGLSGTSYNGSSAVTIALATAFGDTTNPYASKTANYFLAAPNGTAGAPTFRAIVAADIPTLNQNTTGTAGGLSGTPNITVGTIASGAITVTGSITATTSITSYYSDDRLKTKTGNIQNALEKVLSLDGFHYHANETAVALGYDASKEEVGLSAQQVNAILPEVVAPAPIDPQYMTLHYERLVPLLVEAIKEQQKQIEELKAKLG